MKKLLIGFGLFSLVVATSPDASSFWGFFREQSPPRESSESLFDDFWTSEFEDFHKFHRSMMRSFWNDDFFESRGKFSVFFDLSEKNGEFIARADIPNFKKSEISAEILQERILRISGEKNSEKSEESDDEKFYFRERSAGKFSRTIVLPARVDSSKISAKFEGGILTVRLPKMPVEPPPKRIEIKID